MATRKFLTCDRKNQALVGRAFGHWTVLEVVYRPYRGSKCTFLRCRCVCGTVRVLQRGSVLCGGTTSCGCVRDIRRRGYVFVTTVQSGGRDVEIRPDTTLLDDRGNDWSWAYVVFRPIPWLIDKIIGSDGSAWKTLKNRGREVGPPEPMSLSDCRGKYKGFQAKRSDTRRPCTVMVHKTVLTVFLEPKPPGMVCRHDPNPDRWNNRIYNLKWGTHAENSRDSLLRGNPNFGSRCRTSKLVEAQVLDLLARHAAGESAESLAEGFGVSTVTINRIVSGRRWRHVTTDEFRRPDLVPELDRVEVDPFPGIPAREGFEFITCEGGTRP